MGNKIDRILKTSLPADAQGNVSVHDVLHWLHDEQYLNADVFTQPEVKKQIKIFLHYLQSFRPRHIHLPSKFGGTVTPHATPTPVAATPAAATPAAPVSAEQQQLDKDVKVIHDRLDDASKAAMADSKVPRSALVSFFQSLPEASVDAILASLEETEAQQRKRILEAVCHAMDVRSDGVITRQELMEWIKLEGNFQSAVYHDYKALKHKVDEFLKRAAGKADVPGITYEELQHYFADWSVRDIMNVTYDLVTRFAVFKREREADIKEIFAQLAGKEGISTRHIEEWLKMERQFFSNNLRLMRILQPALEEESKGYNMLIQPDELRWFLFSLPEEEFAVLKQHLASRKKLRESIVRVIFSALDQDKDGLVDKRDLYNWVNNESAFWGIISSSATPAEKARHQAFASRQRKLLAEINYDQTQASWEQTTVNLKSAFAPQVMDQKLTVSALAAMFQSWSIWEMRRITETLLSSQKQNAALHKALLEELAKASKEGHVELKHLASATPSYSPTDPMAHPELAWAFAQDQAIKRAQLEHKRQAEASIKAGAPALHHVPPPDDGVSDAMKDGFLDDQSMRTHLLGFGSAGVNGRRSGSEDPDLRYYSSEIITFTSSSGMFGGPGNAGSYSLTRTVIAPRLIASPMLVWHSVSPSRQQMLDALPEEPINIDVLNHNFHLAHQQQVPPPDGPSERIKAAFIRDRLDKMEQLVKRQAVERQILKGDFKLQPASAQPPSGLSDMQRQMFLEERARKELLLTADADLRSLPGDVHPGDGLSEAIKAAYRADAAVKGHQMEALDHVKSQIPHAAEQLRPAEVKHDDALTTGQKFAYLQEKTKAAIVQGSTAQHLTHVEPPSTLTGTVPAEIKAQFVADQAVKTELKGHKEQVHSAVVQGAFALKKTSDVVPSTEPSAAIKEAFVADEVVKKQQKESLTRVHQAIHARGPSSGATDAQ